ncbi:MAG: hypothetical protein LC624_05760 [Halobacteriales archaeon]|nr:hypothetical protein [Halobacteriales archaeon]
MNLDPPPRNLDGVREMKVKIPLRLHISLHSMKLLSGRQLSDIVTEALVAYMAHQAEARQHGDRLFAGYDQAALVGSEGPPGPTAGY